MKQRFLLSVLFVCSLAVTTQAQINKGATWLGGQVGYSQTTNKSGSTTTGKSTTFNFSPAVGTAVKENLIVGVFVNYTTYKNKSGITTIKKEESIGGGLFVRKYFPIVNRLYVFGDARAFFNSYKFKDNANSPENKVKGWDAGISVTPGVSYAITKNIQIETGVNSLFTTRYQKRKYESGFTETDGNSFNAGVFLDNSTQLFIGFRFLINKKA